MTFAAASFLLLPIYAHEVRDRWVTNGEIRANRSEVRVFDATSRKTIWRRTFEAPSIAWSSDRRTIGILDGETWTTWQAGDRVKQVELKGPLSGEQENESSMKWAPDGTRLIVIGPMTQGEITLTIGRLVVLTPGSSRIQHVADSVNNAQWIGHRRIQYEVWDYREHGEVLKTKKDVSVR